MEMKILDKKIKKIVLTGGGTGGHVTPNIALIPFLKNEDYEIFYIGREGNSADIIEKKLIEQEGIPYFGINGGKLRRYLSMENAKDVLKTTKGIFEARKILKEIKPDIIFSKGGFITVPVIIAAKALNIPVIIHESDFTVGLANKISIPLSKRVCVSFEDTIKYLPKDKVVWTGPPIREEIFNGSKIEATKILDFIKDRPVLMIIGGSMGSNVINQLIFDNINILTSEFNIIHICGKGNKRGIKNSRYISFEYVGEELKDLFAFCDIVITRGGSNSIFELLALNKPNIIIPLSKNASRGDQILNADEFERKGYSKVIKEENLEISHFMKELRELYSNRKIYSDNMKRSGFYNGIGKIMEEIKTYTK